MKVKDIIDIFGSWAEHKLIDSWDNTGFQVGNDELEIQSILIALDLDEDVLDKAIKGGYDMIITHHPLIFKPLRDINNSTYIGRLILKIISNKIVVFNAHSNLDLAKGGVNDVLASALKLTNTKPLNKLTNDESYGYGRIGYIEEIDTKTFLDVIKESLKVNDIRVYGNTNRLISKIAVCGGSGGEFIIDAFNNGADIYVTGDIKYHEAQLGLQLGLIIVDAGHFHTEKLILPKMKEVLLSKLTGEINIDVYNETVVFYKIY